MILTRSKTMSLPNVTLRTIYIIIGLCLLILGAGLVIDSLRPRESHCVMAAQQEGAPPVSTEMRCFTTQVEALKYATDGRIDLPPDASREQIEYALNHQTP